LQGSAIRIGALYPLSGSQASGGREEYQGLQTAASLINASGWRDAQLVGFGVKIGIIDAGFQGYSALLGTRLPAAVDTSCTQQPVENGESHGTAVAEVARDVYKTRAEAQHGLRLQRGRWRVIYAASQVEAVKLAEGGARKVTAFA